MHFCVLCKNSGWPKKMTGKQFGEKSPVQCTHNLIVKTLSKLLYLAPFFEINAILHFTQKFKMAAKIGGKIIFGKSRQ